MKKLLHIFILAIALILVIALKFTSSDKKNMELSEKKVLISTSFYPLYFFTSQIAGEKMLVNSLTKADVDSHDFEPSTNDLRDISESKLLIMNGLGFESWMEKLANELSDRPEILKTSENLAYLRSEDEEDDRGKFDPHVWLDPVLAKEQVKLITSKITEIDPENAFYYLEREEKLLEELEKLNLAFAQGLANCSQRNVITSHAAFAYLAERYDFKQIAIQGLNPEEEPSPAKLAELSRLAKEMEVEYIFFENLLNPKLAETLAREVGAKTLIFHPLESLTLTEENSGANYFNIQYQNLKNLRTAMNCQ